MLVSTVEELERVVERAAQWPVLVYDLETTGLHPFLGDRLIGIALLIPDGKGEEAYYLPFRHAIGPNLPIPSMRMLAPLLTDPKRCLVGFNIKFDNHFSLVDGIPVFNQIVDVMLGAHLANENEMQFKLKRLGDKYMGANAGDAERDLQKELKSHGWGKSDMWRLPSAQVAPYAEQDVILTWQLCVWYQQALKRDNLESLWDEVNEYLGAVAAMERRGVLVNREQAAVQAEEALTLQEKQLQRIRELAGNSDFNPNSPPQVRDLLGTKAANIEALQRCKNPLADEILKYRQYTKAIGTWYKPMTDLADEFNRVHPSINLHGTVTGRPSCSGPNLQALPKRHDFYRVRDLIIAPPGYILMDWDWSQAELRLLGHYSGDPFLLEAYNSGQSSDIHQATADRMGVPREIAKRINFGIVYGIGATSLSHQLKCSKAQAAAYLKQYHAMVPRVMELYNTAERIARVKKQIPMWTGRLKRYNEHYETRKASSNLIQGGVAEMMRVAITKLHHAFEGTRIHMVLQVHDEILTEVPDDPESIAFAGRTMQHLMEDFDFDVPIVADGRIGKTWGSMTAYHVEED